MLSLANYKLSPLSSNPSNHSRSTISSYSRTTENMDFLLGDFCLSCDRQTNGTNFCSSACRLTQLDQFTLASSTPSSSPGDTSVTNFFPSLHRSSLNSNSIGIFLPPAYDFSIHRTPSSNSLSTVSSRPVSPRLSEQAQNDLKDYVGSFDQTRTLKRRVSMQSNEDMKSSWRGQ